MDGTVFVIIWTPLLNFIFLFVVNVFYFTFELLVL